MQENIEGAESPQNKTFDSITWTGKRPLEDEASWEQNKKVMEMLFSLGTPSDFMENDYSTEIPKKYVIDDISIEFLPHWGFYMVGGISLDTPKSEEDIRKDVEAAKYLTQRGLKQR